MVAAMLPQQVPQMPGMMPLGPPPAPPSTIIDAEFQLLVTAEEANIGPKPPPGYVPLPKPTAAQIMTEANEQKERHSQRVFNAAGMDLRLGMEISSIFASDAMWVRLKEIEPQAFPLLRIMHDAICNFIADNTLQHTSLARGMVNREERAAIEGHLTDSHLDWSERHFREGQGDLLRTLTADALSGMVAIYHAPDPGNERTGQRLYRVDPKVVYPIFGRDGLDIVYIVYDATYQEVMRDFSDGVDPETERPNPATRAIQKIAREGQGRGNTRIDPDTSHELIGYYDRERTILTWKGEVIREDDHKLYVCPWHVGVPNWRNTSGAKASGGYSWGGNRTGPLIEANGVSTPYDGMSLGGSAQQDVSRMYEPFLTPWLTVTDKIERGDTRVNYALDRALAQPKVYKRASGNSTSGTPEIQNFRDGVTEIEEDEELDFLPGEPLTNAFAPWMELRTIELQMAIPSVLMQGQNIGTQASGNALDTIKEMGLGIFSPVPAFMQRLFGEIDHRDLTYIRDWSPAYGDGLAVPSRSQSGYGADPLRLTAEMLHRADCYVECTLNRLSLAGMANTATTIAILDQQAHLGTRRLWGQLVGFTNPEQLENERRQQDLEDTPGFAEGRAIEYLKDSMDQAAALKDEQSLRRTAAFAKRVAAKQTMHDLALAKMSGMVETQPEPMPGELPANTGQPGGNPMPYLSSPEVGRETGTQGGAPTQTQMPLPGQG